MTAKTAAILFGFLFLVLGLLGLVSNPVIGPGAYFLADRTHSFVHIGTAILLFLFAMAVPNLTGGFMILLGLLYLSLGIIGYVSFGEEEEGKVLGVLLTNKAGNYLHIALGLLMAVVSILSKKRKHA